MAINVDIKKKLKGFSLDVNFQKGDERLGILGASGGGKSMTLKCIAGIETPDSGTIVLNNRVLFDSNKKINLKPQDRNVGYLFQNYALFPNMTVEENVAVGLKLKREEKADIVADCMKRFKLKGLEKRYPRQLSGGQQQRVALARILAYQPEVIMLDEPFSALDSFLKDALQDQLLEMLEGYAGDIIVVSHNRDEIYKFCEKLVVVSSGRSIHYGSTKQIFKYPKYAEAAKLTGCKNISRIKKLASNRLYAESWGVELVTEQEISDAIRYVGIRAHSFVPCTSMEQENSMEIQMDAIFETPFEMQYKISNKNMNDADKEDNEEASLRWYLPKAVLKSQLKEELPRYISLPKEELLLLE
ncbi:sulfate/molybdate ABC transporter ATP-binding protein [Clostridium sp. Marseille-P299]|uniref:sulfate/molybdate ABC transporter ATP-binding protein n=1 Tax=Clostridium sp. Marseille-P299 TaxID=1805477 RepID=UPI00082B8909|nr:ATP-binding cassette domain-containing protein [Clostridium sp. Marseille-P299]